MYLKKSKRKNGRVYLSICTNYRENGKNKTKTIQSIGYVDQFNDVFEDPIAHFEAVAQTMDAERRQVDTPIIMQFNPSSRINAHKWMRKNLGYAVLSSYYHQLNLHTFWQTQAIRSHFPADANAIFKLLVYSRLLYPSTKRIAFAEKDRWFERNDFSLAELYRSLNLFCSSERELISRINTSINAIYERRFDRLYYHVMDLTSPFLTSEKSDKASSAETSIKFGLLLDSYGIPLSYRLSEGTVSGHSMLDSLMKELDQGRFANTGRSRVVAVSDKPVTLENLCSYIHNGHGFILSDVATDHSEDLTTWLMDPADVHSLGELRVKSRTLSLTIEEGDKGTSTIAVKQIAFKRSDFELFLDLQHTRNARKYQRSRQRQKKQYGPPQVKSSTRRPITKFAAEIPIGSTNFDETTLALDEVLEGYRIIVTSEVDLDEKAIVDLYRSFWKIEKDFAIAESDLLTRPVYVSEDDLVRSHFLISYVALTLTRLMCLDIEWKYSSIRVCEELSRLECSYLQENWWHFDYRSEVTDDLCALVGIDLSKRTLSLRQIKSILAYTRKEPGSKGKNKNGPSTSLRQWRKQNTRLHR